MSIKAGVKWVALGCIHVPHQDLAALRTAIAFVKDFKPDQLIVLGDLCNVGMIGSHASPQPRTLKAELAEGEDVLDKLARAAPKAKRVYMEGNHEERLRRTEIVSPDFQDFLQIEVLMDLRKRGFTFYKYGQRVVHRIGDLMFHHGVHHGVYATAEHARRYGNIVHAHTHRLQSFTAPAFDARAAMSTGCLCDLSPDYARRLPVNGWAHGLAFGYVAKSGRPSMYQLPIHDGEAFAPTGFRAIR